MLKKKITTVYLLIHPNQFSDWKWAKGCSTCIPFHEDVLCRC